MTIILLIDDSPTILMSVSLMLTKAGMKVETATDGLDALEKLKQGLKPNLIISDVNMPRLDGVSFVREARRAGHRFVPILMLTTESEQSKRTEAKSAGATGWLVKPVTADSLLGVIRQVVPGA